MSSSKAPIRSPSPTGSVRSTAPAGIGTSAYGDKKDGLKVEYFYGDRAKLGMFLVQLQAMFTLKPGDFNTHPSRVLYAAMHMRGSAFHWIEPLMKDYLTYSSGQWEEETREIFSKYDNFVERVTQIFGTPGEEHQAAQRIHNLRQTGSAAQYFALFQRLKAKLNWEENAYTAAFYQGLKDPIKDEMGMKPPKKLKDLVDRAIEIDNWLYERRLDKKGYRGKIGGSFYKSKNYQSHGDPMDLDAMERGRSSRPKGKFQHKGPFNQERERRKKDNLCYNCGKSGHMARECGTKPERLHMIDDTTGIEAKKADTSIEKELARMRIQAENASIAEKAQKESTVQTQEKRASPPSPVNDEEGVIETANTRRQRKKRQNEAAVQAACEKARQAAHKHRRTSWAFCSDDDCTIHQSDKEKSGKFPHGKSNQGQEQEGILMMEPGEVPHWEKFRVIMQGKTVAVLSTRHWIDGPCTEACPRLGVPGCEGTHRRFSPHENPEARDEMVPITRCDDGGCEYHGPHTHDIIGEDKYDFPFEDEETDSDGEWEQVETTEDNKYEVLKTGVLYAVVRTNHWLEMKCQTPGGCDRIHRVVDPRSLEKPEKNVVLWRCPGCDKTTTPHTHDFLNHQDYHEFPFFDERDWTKQQRTEEISMKYRPIKLYEAGLAIRTHYWTVHNNKTWYAPKGYVQQTFRTLLLPTCKRETCENYGPTHTHAILGVKTHFFTLADAEPDSEVELEESEPSEYEEEAEYVMMMQPEEDQEKGEDEETKFIVINFTKTTHEVITPYWRNVTCRLTSCPHNRQHAHRIYDPDTTPKIPKQVVIRLCQNGDCQYAPELHAHQGSDDDYTNVNLATAAAQMVYGKDHPTMEDLPKNEVEEDS